MAGVSRSTRGLAVGERNGPADRMRARWDLETDVVVVGSGAAGLTAALAARAAGAEVALLEKTALAGGTTAVSAGAVWIPAHPHLPGDSAAAARTYLHRLSGGRGDWARTEAFLAAGPAAVRFVETSTPLVLAPLAGLPDYLPAVAGAHSGGRSLDPGLYDSRRLGAWDGRLRRSPLFAGAVLTLDETLRYRPWADLAGLPVGRLAARAAERTVHYGAALAGGLLEGLLARGVEPRLEAAARRLHVDGARVVGLEAEFRGRPWRLRARRGVVLASGGFEWDRRLAGRHLGTGVAPLSPPANEGDGLRMAIAAGAAADDLDQAWWCPAVALPGEAYDGRPLWRGDFTQRALPHAILVDRTARRFVNEAMNYHDVGRALLARDPASGQPRHQPAWLLFDRCYLERYPLHAHLPGMPEPTWATRAESLVELAARLEIDPRALAATVERFNRFAREGIDPDFHRGEDAFDRLYGDAAHAPHPSLGPLETAPFYAVAVVPGTLGSSGGVRTDGEGRALDREGRAVEGLYAAGNVAAGFTGAGYPGGGCTIGAAITFGYLAGSAAARDGLRPAAAAAPAGGAP